MPSCAVKNCKNNSRNTKNTGIRYFSFPKKNEMIEKWIVLCKENVDPKIARVCSEHFDFSQYKNASWLRKILPAYSPVKSRKLKPDAIPIPIVMENVLETDVVAHCIQIATDCVASSSANPVVSSCSVNEMASCSASPIASSYSANEMVPCSVNEMALCSVSEMVCSASEIAPCSASPIASSSMSPVASCSRNDDNFGSSEVSNNAEVQQLMKENASLLLKNKVLQQQLVRKNKLFDKMMKKKLQDMLSLFHAWTN
nr:PREDICTED: uncharacterized protein LOC105668131 [Linepithema humile]